MAKKLSPKQLFLLLYVSTVAFIAITSELDVSVLGLFSLFGAPLLVIIIFFVIVAIPSGRMALAKLEIPEKYSPKHFLLLL